MICSTSTACIYLDSEACHPSRRLIRKCVWGASWFPLPFSFKQRCSAMISEQTCTRKILSFQLEQKVFKGGDIIMIEASIVLRSKIAPTDNCFQLHLLSCKIISVQAKVFNWFHEGFDWMLASMQKNKASSICWNDTINCSYLLQFVLWRQFLILFLEYLRP